MKQVKFKSDKNWKLCAYYLMNGNRRVRMSLDDAKLEVMTWKAIDNTDDLKQYGWL